MSLVAAALLVLAAEPSLSDRDGRWRFGLSMSGGLSGDAGEVGGSAELGVMPLRYLRLGVDAGAAWSPTGSQGGLVRLLAGADAVLPLSTVELFVGIQSGLAHSNLSHFFFSANDWQWGPALRVRGGVDLLRWRPFLLGFTAAYAMFQRSQFEDFSFGEIGVRFGAVF